MTARNPWIDHSDHSLADWKTEVVNDDTRLGDIDWIAVREDAEDEDSTPSPHR